MGIGFWRCGKGKQLEVLYQLVPLARISKRLRFYEDAAKVASMRRMVNRNANWNAVSR